MRTPFQWYDLRRFSIRALSRKCRDLDASVETWKAAYYEQVEISTRLADDRNAIAQELLDLKKSKGMA